MCSIEWKRHLGTDMLVGSWLFLIFSVEYLAYSIWLIYDGLSEDADDELVGFYGTNVVCAVFFLIGSFWFVQFSYPESMEELFAIDEKRVSEMTWMERYFTGTGLLKATWFFAFSTLPYAVDALVDIIETPDSVDAYAYLAAILLTFALLGIWVYSAFPENMIANGGQGSSAFYDNIIAPCNCCCGGAGCNCKRHFGTDFLAGSWIMAILCALWALDGTYGVIEDVSSISSWASLTMAIGFFLGCSLYVYTSYPENPMTTLAWDTVIGPLCTGGKEPKASTIKISSEEASLMTPFV